MQKNPKIHMEKQNNDSQLTNFKTYDLAMASRWYGGYWLRLDVYEYLDQWDRTGSQQINPYIYVNWLWATDFRVMEMFSNKVMVMVV